MLRFTSAKWSVVRHPSGRFSSFRIFLLCCRKTWMLVIHLRGEADEKCVMVAADTEDAASSRGPRPAAPEALGEPGALRGDDGGRWQDDGGLPRPQGHWAIPLGRHEYCKFYNTKGMRGCGNVYIFWKQIQKLIPVLNVFVNLGL